MNSFNTQIIVIENNPITIEITFIRGNKKGIKKAIIRYIYFETTSLIITFLVTLPFSI